MIVAERDTLLETCKDVYLKKFVPRVPYTPQSGNVNGKFRRASTGNMRFNATSIRRVSPTVIEIKVDAKIAPYVVYTNEPWISPKWKGAKNPNEKWFDKTAEAFARSLAYHLRGKFYEGKKR